jgi:hypothetical protein
MIIDSSILWADNLFILEGFLVLVSCISAVNVGIKKLQPTLQQMNADYGLQDFAEKIFQCRCCS